MLLMQHHHDPQIPSETYAYLIHALRSCSHNHSPFFRQGPIPSAERDDVLSTVEDKRRRNTAASARFRIKKKLKTLNYERTVAELTERTAELERQADDLRRENAWLKELVLLKSRQVDTKNVLGSESEA